MSKSNHKRRSALVGGELPTYARPTRASITRMNCVAGGPHQKCRHKSCSCTDAVLATPKPPPKTRPVAAAMLGNHPHDRARRCASRGRGRGYRAGKIGAQAGPSQLLQHRIKQLARGIKDKHTGQSDETDPPASSNCVSEQVRTTVTENDAPEPDKFQVETNGMGQNKSQRSNLGSLRMQKRNKSAIYDNSSVIWESEESEDSEQLPDSRQVTSKENTVGSTMSSTTSVPGSRQPPPQLKTRRSAVFEPPQIVLDDNPPHKPFYGKLNDTKVNTTPSPQLPLRKRSPSPVRIHDHSENHSHLSDLSLTIIEEVEPLEVEYPADLPARYRSQPIQVIPEPPRRRPNKPVSAVIEEEPTTPLVIEYPPDLPTRYRTQPTPPPVIIEPAASPPLHRPKKPISAVIEEDPATPLTIEYPPDLPARYRSQPTPPVIIEPASPSLVVDSHPIFPVKYRSRKLSRTSLESHAETLPTDIPNRSRTPSLVPGAAPALGWSTPVTGTSRARCNSVINISSSYRARRSSVFGLGSMSSYDGDSDSSGNLTPQTQSRRSSVVELFRRSKQSRHRRLSVYLQTFDNKKESAIERLKRISKTVKIIAGICLNLKRYVKKGETQQWSLIEMHLNLKAEMEKNVAFDPVMFSKLRVTRGSEKLRSILSEKATERTSGDVDVVLALLRKNKTFTDYNRETQKALAKVMEYLRYEPRRIILKEGHLASGFYIILSGTCLINQKEIDPRNNETFVRTIDEIHSGDSFGSIELLNNCMRTVSVVCKDECEVLLVNKEDFDTIIREPLEMERQHLIEFCNNQNVFEKLPTNFNFAGNHYAISAKNYKPGVVITRDINESDFIYVIKSGKCRVISEVKEIKGRPKPVTKATDKSFNDEVWKKDALLKRSVTVIESMGNKRKWASEPKSRLFQRGRQKTFFNLTGIKKSLDFSEEDEKKDTSPAIPKTLFDEQDILQTRPQTQERPWSGMSTTWRRMSMAASASSEKERRRNPLLYLKPSRLKSTYAEVAILKEGDVFGIETLVKVNQSETRLSLLSEGADCIVISKKFFATQATMKTIQNSTKSAIEYPSAEFTLNQIRQARAWSSYKDSLVKDVYRKKAKAELCR
ncbi:uncharacterized protein [Asterias amurensis]|uniref:uncharacterized protein isoform X2 n=1 Tax=Asterias amurensis TaxID=7602 RepID=UPI003AB38EE4